MLRILGIALIVIGCLLLVVTVLYGKRKDIRKEMFEYRKLQKSGDSDYIPPQPMEHTYEKKPIGNFVVEMKDDEVDSLFAGESLKDDEVAQDGTAIMEEETGVLVEESTDILESGVEESTDILEEATDILKEETSEKTDVL